MPYLRRLFTLAAMFTMLWTSAEAQITATYTFSPGTVIRSADVNANFALLGDALNRTGGTMTGSLTVNNVLPEADNTRDLGSAALSFNDAWFDGTVTLATATITSASVTSFSAALLPNGDNTLNIGSAGASWASAWFDGTVTMATAAITTLTCTGCVDATQLASTTVTAAAYGSASGVATFTVDADGRLTTAATTAIAIATSQVTSGNYVATVTAGSGIAVGTGTGTGSTPAFSLTALTADWTQSGAYDIVLAHSDSDLKILESTGGAFYGIFNVGDLGADATYTFVGTSGSVLTNATTTLSATLTQLNIGSGINGLVLGTPGGLWPAGTGLGYEGATSDDFQLLVVAADPTADRTITFPDLTGTVALLGTAQNAANLLFVDDTYDIGASGATRPRHLYLSKNLVVGGTATITTFANAAVESVAAGTYAGDDSIVTVGTVATGVWNAGSVTSSGGISGTTGGFSSTLTLSGTAANIALGANYLSGDGGDEGINVSSTGTVGIQVVAASTASLRTEFAGVTTVDIYSGYFTNTGTNSTTDGLSKFGLYVDSSGVFTGSGGASTTNIGIQATASGADVNWAGYFIGNVTITGTASAVGTITSGVWNAGAVTSSGGISGTTGNFTSTVTTKIAGTTNDVRIGLASSGTTYHAISFNASMTDAGILGLIGGGGSDTALYINVPATGIFNFRVAGVSVANLSSAGVLTVNGFGTHTFSAGGTGNNRISVVNPTAGTGNRAMLSLTADTAITYVYANASTFTPSGIDVANGSVVQATAAGGLSIAATDASGVIRFYAGGTTQSGAFTGTAFNVVGALSKGSGTFLIDHPLDVLAPTTDLYHGFIEGPRYDLLYRGSVQLDGEASVSIDTEARMTPGTFVALTQDPQVWAQHEDGASVKAWVDDGVVHLASATPGRVSWLVVAERHDPYIRTTEMVDASGRLVPEQQKPKGQGLRHPDARKGKSH